MKRQERCLMLIAGLLTGTTACYSPTVDEPSPDASSDESGSSTGAGSTTASSDTEDSASGHTATTGNDSTTGKQTGAESDSSPSTAGPSSETTSADTESGGETSYCGDGVLDPGEDCDDGPDNALDGSCLPDCNLNFCGDSNVGPGEVCDEGADDNVLEPGACAPDCSGFIETRHLVISDFGLAQEDGNFGPNRLATADAMCPTGYAALIAIPGARQVTNAPYQANAIVDWPLAPFTQYVNPDGEQVWITDDVPLLGVRDGVPEALENQIYPTAIFGGPNVATGMNNDWTVDTAENCVNFTSSSASSDLRYGSLSATESFLSVSVTTACNDVFAQVLCVEL